MASFLSVHYTPEGISSNRQADPGMALPERPDRVALKRTVPSHTGQVFQFGLGDQQAIERVRVDIRKRPGPTRMQSGDRKLEEAVERDLRDVAALRGHQGRCTQPLRFLDVAKGKANRVS